MPCGAAAHVTLRASSLALRSVSTSFLATLRAFSAATSLALSRCICMHNTGALPPLNVCRLCVHRGPAVSLPSQQVVGVEDSGLPPHGWGSPRTWLPNFISSTTSTYVGRCPSHDGLTPSCIPINHVCRLKLQMQPTSVRCRAVDRKFDVPRRVSAESPFQKSKLGFERGCGAVIYYTCIQADRYVQASTSCSEAG